MEEIMPTIKAFIKKILTFTGLIRPGVNLDSEYEPPVIQAISRCVKEGDTCIDVGACIGDISIRLALLVGHPVNVKNLNRNIRVHQVPDCITVLDKAVNDGKTKEIWLFSGRSMSEYEWNIVGHDTDGKKTKPMLKIEAVSLDGVFSKDQRIDFIKIDAECAEAIIFEGMRNILKNQKPALIIEFHDDTGWAGRKILTDAGYQLFTLDFEPVSPDSERIYHCAAIHRDKIKLLR